MEMSTPRLLLREFRLDDHAAVHGFAGDAEVTRYTDWGPNSPDDTAAFLAEAVRDASGTPRERFGLAVVERESGTLIGSVELQIASVPHRRGEIGYVLHRDWWGKGYAGEAAGRRLRFGFGELGLHKISATCDPGNVASARVLTKIGMRLEGRLREHLHLRGRWRDRLLYAGLAGPVAGQGVSWEAR
ncbi:GNAT family N-acetyltransferase [Spirillospora sp. NPDC029432]|uniref:GNAT family N-acetyltransferase n=1 Tax=Spirillospora sp. NPDC029432 TaxID=3154599 RepID=UPI0034519664